MSKQEPMSELARLSDLCDQTLRSVNYDPESFQPVSDLLPHVLGELQYGGGKYSEIRRKMATGFYDEAKITEKIFEKIADDLLRKPGETN